MRPFLNSAEISVPLSREKKNVISLSTYAKAIPTINVKPIISDVSPIICIKSIFLHSSKFCHWVCRNILRMRQSMPNVVRRTGVGATARSPHTEIRRTMHGRHHTLESERI